MSVVGQRLSKSQTIYFSFREQRTKYLETVLFLKNGININFLFIFFSCKTIESYFKIHLLRTLKTHFEYFFLII